MKKILLAASLVLAFASPLTQADELDDLLVLSRPVPRDANDLRVIEYAATKIAATVVQCTVGVQVGNNHGSGVVITESGYVLTAAHVTERPGRNATIKFPDGTTVSGKTLGLHTQADGALIKITDEGSWPYVPVVAADDYPYPKPGDWCIATGHPGGFDKDRTPPVRLGRIIDVNETVIRTDCAINSGDSGGPLFDMQGRVIGIHSRIAEHSTINLHGPVLAYRESWQQMKDGEVYPPEPESRFLDKLDIDRDGKITRTELPEGTYRQLYDRLAEKFELEDETGHTIREFKGLMGWRNVPPAFEIPPYDTENPSEHALARERFVRGRDVRTVFESLASEVQKSIVEVQCNGKRVALGTVVEGGVLTKASQLHDNITCKTHDGRTLAARIAHLDMDQDLALLELDEQLDAVELPDGADLPLGSWLITPGLKGRPISIGVSSVASRVIKGMPGVLGVQIKAYEARVKSVVSDGAAAAAGLKKDDVINRMMSTDVASVREVREHLAMHDAGDLIKISVARDGEILELDVRLRVQGELDAEIDTVETPAIILNVFPRSGAERAGLRQDDVIVKIHSTEVGKFDEVLAALAKHRAGEVVKATVLRDGEPVEFDIRLGMREDIFWADERFGSGSLNGELSLRRDDFPDAIQHDSVLQPEDCGGPLTDLSGKVVGINIARADRVATYALPVKVVQEVLKKFNTEASGESDK